VRYPRSGSVIKVFLKNSPTREMDWVGGTVENPIRPSYQGKLRNKTAEIKYPEGLPLKNGPTKTTGMNHKTTRGVEERRKKRGGK